MELYSPLYHFVFMDETGFTLWTQPRRARAPRGQRVCIRVPPSPCKRIAVVLAMSPTLGPLLMYAFPAALNGGHFRTFLQAFVQTVPSIALTPAAPS